MLIEVIDERVAGRPRYTWLPEGETLPVVPTELLKCVVFLGYRDGAGTDRFMGSGFWVSRPGPEDIKTELRHTYLVTANHVIDDIKKQVSASSSVRFRINTKEGGQKWEDAPICCWKAHPDPGADLAICKIRLDNDLWDHFAWPTEAFVTPVSFLDDGGREILHGDELAIAGLFSPHVGEKRNIPIVRTAHVAALLGEPILNRDSQPMSAYLVECRSIGGLSGSPVFYDIFQAKDKHLGAERIVRVPIKWRLLGVMHGHFDAPDVMPDSKAEQEKILINMGIAIVVPAQRIIEVLEMFNKDEAEEAERFRLKKRSLVSPDSLASESVPEFTQQDFESALRKASRRVLTSESDSEKK